MEDSTALPKCKSDLSDGTTSGLGLVLTLLFFSRTFRTDVPKLGWMNYGLFVGEWIGATNSGTGNAKLDIFEVSTGGRLDGKPIEAIEPGTK